MRTLSRSSDTAVGIGPVLLPRVNLLPPEIAEVRRFRRIQIGLGSGVVVALGVVALLFVAATGSVGDATGQVDAAGSRQSALQAESAQYRDVTATYARTAAAQDMLVAAMSQEVRYSRFLNDLALTLPENVWVLNVAFSQTAAPAGAAGAAATPAGPAGAATAPAGAGLAPVTGGLGTLTVSGVAASHEDVALWLESLAAQKGYASPLLQSSTEALIGTRKVVNWSTTTTLTAEALSGRYTKTGS